MYLMILFSLSLCTFSPECSAAKLPNAIPRCSMDDPQFGNCIVNVAEKLRKPIRDAGIAEMGIPGYGPRVLPHFQVKQLSNMMNFSATLRNSTFRGLDNYEIKEIQFDSQTATFRGKVEFDPISLITGYDVKGTALFIPLRGNGNAHVAMGPINGTFEIMGKIVERKNAKYYDFEDIKIKLDIDDISMYLDGLFDDDQEIAARTNELINRNSRTIMQAITPVVEQLSEKLIARYFRWLTKRYSLDELFLHY